MKFSVARKPDIFPLLCVKVKVAACLLIPFAFSPFPKDSLQIHFDEIAVLYHGSVKITLHAEQLRLPQIYTQSIPGGSC